MAKTIKSCAQTSLATDNTPMVCDEFVSSACVIHPDAMAAFNLPENSTVQDILNSFLFTLIKLNNDTGDISSTEIISGEIVGTELILTKADDSLVTIDISSVFDNVNLARIISGEIVGTNIVLTRDDDSEVTIDISGIETEQNNIVRTIDLGTISYLTGEDPHAAVVDAINNLNTPIEVEDNENIIIVANLQVTP